MDLKTVLKEVESFCGVITLKELLEKVGLTNGLDREDQEITSFIENSLCLIEREITTHEKKKRQVTLDDFVNCLEPLIGCKKVHINDFIQSRMEDFPSTHIQKKDIIKAKSFLYCLKYLVNNNMEWLLSKIGDEALYFLLLNSIILIKENNQYWQLSGKSLEFFFEDLKKGPKGELLVTQQPEPYQKKPIGEPKPKQTGPKIREYFKEYINRNHMLYCLHSNKKPTLFYKNKLSVLAKQARLIGAQKDVAEKDKKNLYAQLGGQLRDAIFTEQQPGLQQAKVFDELAAEWILQFSHTDIEMLYKKTCKISKTFFPLKNEIKKFIKLKECDDKKISEFISKLVKMDTPLADVNRFVVSCIRHMLPESLLGKKNKEYLLTQVSDCVRMKKFEMLSFKEVYKRMVFNDIPWLQQWNHPKARPAVIARNNLIMRQFLYFFFNKIVVELIRANYYATEKHNEHNKLFFYCKPVWYLITQTSMVNLETLNIEKIRMDDDSGREDTEHRAMAGYSGRTKDHLENNPCAKLRLVPKSDSVRPIMTFYKKFKDPKSAKLLKVGHYLKNAKIVLRGWRRILGGYAVFDNYQIFDKYAQFKNDWEAKQRPNIFYATMDIQKCYDSVDLDRLFELLKKENLFKDFYLISEFYKVMRNRRYAFRMKKDGSKGDKFKMSSLFIFKQRNSAIPLRNAGRMNSIIEDEPQKDGFTIILDRHRKRIVSKEDLLESIKFVCYQVRIRFGNQIYRLKKGLPQGLSISSVLSSFYFAVLEHQYLDSIYDGKRLGQHELILRLTDDYLIMSESETLLKNILRRLLECASKNNFSFNQKKLTTNFEFDGYDPKAQDTSKPGEKKDNKLKWIGKIIELDNLEMEHVQVMDYRQIFYTISTNINYLEKFPAQIIKSKLKSFILNHNLFYIDTRVNGYDKIKEILRKVIICAYLKIRTYLGKVLLNTITGHERMIALKIVESLIDCSIAVYRIMDPHGYQQKVDCDTTKDLYELFLNTFLESLHRDKTSKAKKMLYHILKHHVKEAVYQYWMGQQSETLRIVF